MPRRLRSHKRSAKKTTRSKRPPHFTPVVPPCTHVYDRQTTASSLRVHAAAAIMGDRHRFGPMVDPTYQPTRTDPHNNRHHTIRREYNKNAKLHSIFTPVYRDPHALDFLINPDPDSKHRFHLLISGANDGPLRSPPDGIDMPSTMFIRHATEYKIYDTFDSMYLGEGVGVPILVKAGRKAAVRSHGKHASTYFSQLHKLSALTKNFPRGAKKTVFFQEDRKYWVIGDKAMRGGRGISTSTAPLAEIQSTLIGIIRRCEYLLNGLLDRDYLFGIQLALHALGMNSADCMGTIYSSIAGGMNVVLPSHTDDDFFMSVFIILPPPGEDGFYSVDSPILAYFVYPEYDLSVPLRAGDVIAFDATKMHSLSTRVNASHKFYCVSMYLKSAVMGGNDNSVPLSDDLARVIESLRASSAS